MQRGRGISEHNQRCAETAACKIEGTLARNSQEYLRTHTHTKSLQSFFVLQSNNNRLNWSIKTYGKFEHSFERAGLLNDMCAIDFMRLVAVLTQCTQ